jgi:hypothetical protein
MTTANHDLIFCCDAILKADPNFLERVEGSGLRTLPTGKDVNDLAMQFFKKSWKSKKNE